MAMRLYHRTGRDAARTILAHGFRDAWGYYLTDQLWYGVWLSDRPSDADAGEGPEVVLVVDLDVPDEELAEYAWVFDLGTRYRKFLLPADLINRRGTAHVLEAE